MGCSQNQRSHMIQKDCPWIFAVLDLKLNVKIEAVNMCSAEGFELYIICMHSRCIIPYC